ncbi:hypothetical protein JCM6882_001628 [Rhodosporidiobolus microsporus]
MPLPSSSSSSSSSAGPPLLRRIDTAHRNPPGATDAYSHTTRPHDLEHGHAPASTAREQDEEDDSAAWCSSPVSLTNSVSGHAHTHDLNGFSNSSYSSHGGSGGGSAFPFPPSTSTSSSTATATLSNKRRDPTSTVSQTMSATAGSSPTQTHASLIARRGTGGAGGGGGMGSPAQSMSMAPGGGAGNGYAGAAAAGAGTGPGGGYIGGGFAPSHTASSSVASSLSGGGGGGGGRTPTSPSSGRRNSFSAAGAHSRRWWLSRGRTTKLVILALGALVVYWVVGSGRGWWKTEEVEREVLRYRWWEGEEGAAAEDLPALLPRPVLPPRPPRPKPPPSLPSHTHSQLLKLPSSFSASTTDYTAILHLTSSSHSLPAHLSALLRSVAAQTPPPRQIVLLTPSGLEPSPSTLSAAAGASSVAHLITTFSYPPSQAPVVALAKAAQTQVASDWILYVDGNLPSSSSSSARGEEQSAAPPLPKEYARTLLHAAGTREYAAAVLTGGGLFLPPPASSPSAHHTSAQCIYPSSSSSSLSSSSSPSSASPPTTHPLTLPSLPFLLSTSWLLPTTATSSASKPPASILQGLNTALPLEVALAAALWTKHAIPVWGVPTSLGSPSSASSSSASSSASGGTVDGWACERLRRSVLSSPSSSSDGDGDTSAAPIAALFAPHLGGGEGLRRLRSSGDRLKGGASAAVSLSAAEAADEERSRLLSEGTVVLLLSGREEVEAARRVGCRFAAGLGGGGGASGKGGARARTDLKVVVADYDLARAAKDEDADEAGAGAGGCHLEFTPLGSASSSSSTSSSSSSSSGSTTGEPISLALVDLLDALSPAPAFVLYLTDGPRAREFEEVLRWMGGVFGPRRGAGGERWSRVKAEREVLKGVIGAGAKGEDEGEGGSRGRGRPTVVGMRREEVRRAEWVGALEVEALRHWHTPRIDLSVVTNDRPVSLHRLLSSLQTAYYYGDDVSLAVNLEQTADRLTHRLVDDLRWPHGTFNLRHRILLGGLMPAIVESWYPTSNDSYGVLLEDDVEVSPLFYGWLKFTILQYRYTLAGRRASQRLFGVSLYQQKNIELRPEGRQPFDAHELFKDLNLHPTSPYLSQIPCSWGAAYFPEIWREFHTYLSLRLSELALPISEPIIPAIRSNRWPRSWKKYFNELVFLRGYSSLYPNFPEFESLSTNHLEKGAHVHTSQVEEKKKSLFEVPLLGRDGSLVDSLPGGPGRERLPAYDALPVMDLWGALAAPDELLERGWQTTRMVGSCGTSSRALPDLTAPPTFNARELLCRRVWDRETEGRLVNAQPLRGREEVERAAVAVAAGEDQGRAAAAAAEQAVVPPAPVVERDGGGGVGAARAAELAEERAFFPAPPEPLAPAPRRPAARAYVPAEDADLEDEDEDDARPARPQHDHLHEDASIQEGELDDADAGKRGALFDEAEGAGGGEQPRRKWRKAVDLVAREEAERESEWAIDEDESEEVALGAGEEPEEEAEEEEPKGVRWARAD